MHISEGVLSAPVLITGAVLTTGGVIIGLKKMPYEQIPEVAVLLSAFFVASLIHVPIGPSSVHLVLNGLIGLLLGWMTFPAIFVALTLQALLFQFGGLTTLGVNTFNMATPGLLAFYLFRPFALSEKTIISGLAGFLSGTTGIGLGALLVAISLVTTGKAFMNVAKLVIIIHLPLMVIEGIITAFCIIFLKKVKPELLEAKI